MSTYVNSFAHSSGGATPFHSRTLNSSASPVSIGAGRLYSFDALNVSANDIYLKFYDEASGSVNPASDTPFLGPFLVQAGVGMERRCVEGIQFNTQISVRAVHNLVDNDTASPTANDLLFNAEYK